MPKMSTSGFIITIALIGAFVLGIVILTWWVKRDRSVKHGSLRDALAPITELAFDTLLIIQDTYKPEHIESTPITIRWKLNAPTTVQAFIKDAYIGSLEIPDTLTAQQEYTNVPMMILNPAPLQSLLKKESTTLDTSKPGEVLLRPDIIKSIHREVYKSKKFVEVLTKPQPTLW